MEEVPSVNLQGSGGVAGRMGDMKRRYGMEGRASGHIESGGCMQKSLIRGQGTVLASVTAAAAAAAAGE